MSEVIIKLNELEEIFWKVTMLILGLDPEDKTKHSKVRLTWPTDGAPAWKIDEDICFITVTQRDDLINRERYVTNRDIADGYDIEQTIEYTRNISCSYILYGPNSYDNAELIQNSLFLPEYKEMLNEKYLYLVPDMAAPMRAPELFAGQWWERSDFETYFNLFVRRKNIVKNIENIDLKIVSGKENE